MSSSNEPKVNNTDDGKKTSSDSTAKKSSIGITLAICAVGLLLYAIISNASKPNLSTESNRVQSVHESASDIDLSPDGEYLLARFSELQNFRTTVAFETYGFAPAGPYYEWMNELDAWRASRDGLAWSLATDIMNLGVMYLSEGDPGNNETFLESQIPEDIRAYLVEE